MKSAQKFAAILSQLQMLPRVDCLKVELFGSLAFTGKGHGTDNAILLGLEGQLPDTVDPATIRPRALEIIANKRLNLDGKREISFDYPLNFLFNFKDLLPTHTNGMLFSAYDSDGAQLLSRIYYS